MNRETKNIRKDVISKTIAGLEARKKVLACNPGKKSTKIWCQAMIDYLKAPLLAQEAGKPFGWIQDQGPVEFFYAMGVEPFFHEHWSALAAMQDAAVPFLEVAESHNLNNLCSIHRAYCGALSAGELPPPDFMVGVKGPYASVAVGIQFAANLEDNAVLASKKDLYGTGYKGTPLLLLDSPHECDEGAIDYYVEELKECILFMETILGKKLNYDELNKSVERTCEAVRLIGMNNQLSKKIPCPRPSRELIRDPFILIGSQSANDYFEAVHEEMQALVEKGEGAVPDERIRLGLLGTPPIRALSFLDQIEKEFGAAFVMNTNNAGWQGGDGANGKPMSPVFPGDPLRTIAAKHLYHYASTVYKDVHRFSNVAVRMVRDYRLDGVIYCAHQGLKNFCAINKHIREDIQEQTGVPTLFLEFDVIDSRSSSVPHLVNSVREFIEMIKQKNR